MSLSMHSVAVPTLSRMLGNLASILDKAAAHAEARGIDPAVLLNYRLAPDMFPLARQVQIATDMAKGCAARLAGVEPPKYEDDETGIDELKARIAKTVDFVKSFAPEQIDGSEDRPIHLKMRDRELNLDGQNYLLHFVLPNVYFHITTAYDILRHAGVPLGKRDYIGA